MFLCYRYEINYKFTGHQKGNTIVILVIKLLINCSNYSGSCLPVWAETKATVYQCCDINLRAALSGGGGRMWPTGLQLPTPELHHTGAQLLSGHVLVTEDLFQLLKKQKIKRKKWGRGVCFKQHYETLWHCSYRLCPKNHTNRNTVSLELIVNA